MLLKSLLGVLESDPLRAGTANTAMAYHKGKIFALYETNLPFEVAYSESEKRVENYGGSDTGADGDCLEDRENELSADDETPQQSFLIKDQPLDTLEPLKRNPSSLTSIATTASLLDQAEAAGLPVDQEFLDRLDELSWKSTIESILFMLFVMLNRLRKTNIGFYLQLWKPNILVIGFPCSMHFCDRDSGLAYTNAYVLCYCSSSG